MQKVSILIIATLIVSAFASVDPAITNVPQDKTPADEAFETQPKFASQLGCIHFQQGIQTGAQCKAKWDAWVAIGTTQFGFQLAQFTQDLNSANCNLATYNTCIQTTVDSTFANAAEAKAYWDCQLVNCKITIKQFNTWDVCAVKLLSPAGTCFQQFSQYVATNTQTAKTEITNFATCVIDSTDTECKSWYFNECLKNCAKSSFTSEKAVTLWTCLETNTNNTTDCPNRVKVVAALKLAKENAAGTPDIQVNNAAGDQQQQGDDNKEDDIKDDEKKPVDKKDAEKNVGENNSSTIISAFAAIALILAL